MSDDNIPGRIGDLAEALVKMEPREIVARTLYVDRLDGLGYSGDVLMSWKRINPILRESWLSQADAILSALSENGYKVLGRGPTYEMVGGAIQRKRVKHETTHEMFTAIWQEMHDKA